MDKHIYIDESGDLGKFGSKYFIVAAVVVSEPKNLSRIIKKLRQRKMKKTIRQLSEIKANNSNRILREYVLRKVRDVKDCSIFSVVVKKQYILDYLFDIQNKLYNYLCGILLSKTAVGADRLVITVDKKHTNTMIRDDFDSYIKGKLKEKGKSIGVEICHKHSHDSNELQVVDFVAWSVFRKFNSDDDFYYNIIEEKIVNKENMLIWK